MSAARSVQPARPVPEENGGNPEVREFPERLALEGRSARKVLPGQLGPEVSAEKKEIKGKKAKKGKKATKESRESAE